MTILFFKKYRHSRERVSCLSAISTYFLKKSITKSHKLFKGTVNAESYLDFIKENLEYFKKKILLQDNARMHYAKIVSVFAKENHF